MTSPELRKVSRAADKATSALTERNRAILQAHYRGETIRAIAESADLSSSRVHQIIHGR